jgi:hypothetical protein
VTVRVQVSEEVMLAVLCGVDCGVSVSDAVTNRTRVGVIVRVGEKGTDKTCVFVQAENTAMPDMIKIKKIFIPSPP